jgi:hypothetical protein
VSLAAEVLYGSGGRTLEASVVQVYRYRDNIAALYIYCILTVLLSLNYDALAKWILAIGRYYKLSLRLSI